MAAEHSLRCHEQEGVAAVFVRVAADERSADDRAVAAGESQHQLRRRSVGRQRRIGYPIVERHPGVEKLGKDDLLGAPPPGLVGRGLAPAQVLRDVADRGLQLDGGDLHGERTRAAGAPARALARAQAVFGHPAGSVGTLSVCST